MLWVDISPFPYKTKLKYLKNAHIFNLYSKTFSILNSQEFFFALKNIAKIRKLQGMV